MFKWKKEGRIFDPASVMGKPWLHEFAQAPSVLIYENYVRVYFACRPAPDSKGQYVSYTGFVDLNRFNLKEILRVSERPIMELGELGTFDEFGTYPASVIRMENEVWSYYAGWTRCESVPFNVAIGLAVSQDGGETFQRIGKGPILSYNTHEPFIIGGPKIRRFNNMYYLWYIAGKKWLLDGHRREIVNKIRFATSSDGLHWARNFIDIIENRIEANECQASPDVFFFKNKYHMFFCYRYSLNFRSKAGGYRIGYAFSEDLKNWTRDDSQAGIEVAEEGWDSEMISYPHVFDLDGNLYMLYLGNQVGRFGFGLARLEQY